MEGRWSSRRMWQRGKEAEEGSVVGGGGGGMGGGRGRGKEETSHHPQQASFLKKPI